VDILGGVYLAAISLVGSLGRALSKGLPESFQTRLKAQAPFSLELGWIWLHAVSVGELLLAAGLLKKLNEAGYQVHITTGTQAGLELLKMRLPAWDAGSGRVTGGGFPLDDMQGLKSFFEVPPSLFIALETEIWPNLFKELEYRDIPCCIVNGRLTARTIDSKLMPWLRSAASRLSLVAARDAESAERFCSLGAPNVVMGGNLKADILPPLSLHDGWKMLQTAWQGVPILVAGNTVDGEEAVILAAWRYAKEKFPKLRLIIAPRQPKQFDLAARRISDEGISYQRATSAWPLGTDQLREIQVLLLDTMGELASVYSLGHIALVGGGWRWHGGHNPIEPLYWGVPTLIGPGYTNFEDLVKPLLEAGCLHVVRSEDLGKQILHILTQTDLDEQRANSIKIPECLQGCLQRTWSYLAPYLPPTSGVKNISSFFRSNQC
jgi:3-deoxy-D-manno-octulosonic-acid transferase